MKTLKSKKSLKWILIIFSIFFLLGLFFLGFMYSAYSHASKVTQTAKNAYHKGNTESLLLLVNSSSFSLELKNKAIGVLGTLKDKKALPVLEKLVTHQPCRHSKYVCQYELEKAILKIKGDYAGTQKPINAFLYKVTDGLVGFSYKLFSLG